MDKQDITVALDPRFVRMIDELARMRSTTRDQVIYDAIRKYLLHDLFEKQDTPKWWDTFYQETFENR